MCYFSITNVIVDISTIITIIAKINIIISRSCYLHKIYKVGQPIFQS